MKKIIFLLAISLFAFVGCTSSPVEEESLETYTISSDCGLNGNVPKMILVTKGQNATVDICPDPGCMVDVLIVDGVSVPPTRHFTFYGVNSDHKIYVTFKKAVHLDLSLIFNKKFIQDSAWFFREDPENWDHFVSDPKREYSMIYFPDGHFKMFLKENNKTNLMEDSFWSSYVEENKAYLSRPSFKQEVIYLDSKKLILGVENNYFLYYSVH